MSLFGSLQIGANTLQAMQIGLQVVGNNIANANTPGYIRERTVFEPAPVQRMGNLTLGLGVEVAGIVQNLDRFVEQRLRDAGGDRASAEVQENVYDDLEAVLGELSDTDLSTLMTSFFNSIDEVMNQPEAVAMRGLAVQSGLTLTSSINTLNNRVTTIYQDFAQQVDLLANEVNSLTEEIRKLNLRIVELEGDQATTQAGGLRSARHAALKRLGEIADIKAFETRTGSVNVSVGGEYLVFEGTRTEVEVEKGAVDGRLTANIVFANNNSPLRVGSGELFGVYEARDRIAGGFLQRLDDFAGALAFEFNKAYSQGQGITGFTEVTSQERVADPEAALDASGLPFTPVGGSFDLQLVNVETGLTQTHTVVVDLNGLDGDTTLSSLAAQLDAIDGVAAEITYDNRLKIRAQSNETQLAFSGDTSGALAALGVNTFFTGSRAGDLSVHATLRADPSKFAAAADGVGVGVENAQQLVALLDQGIASLNGSTITGFYDQLVNETTQGATVATAVADGLRTFEATLDAKALGVSGVNIDEEAIDMIMLQRTYQAAARYISTLSELLDTLIRL